MFSSINRRSDLAGGLARSGRAKRMLEQSDLTIDRISWEVGYEDAAAFRRLFKRIARVTPSTDRRKFAPAAMR